MAMDLLLGSGVWTDWFFVTVDWFRAMGLYVWIAIAWGILLMAIFLGLVGVVVPLIPGVIVLFSAAWFIR
jgi:hypothetical protein